MERTRVVDKLELRGDGRLLVKISRSDLMDLEGILRERLLSGCFTSVDQLEDAQDLYDKISALSTWFFKPDNRDIMVSSVKRTIEVE